jgi:spore coat-associated protein N
MNRLSLADLWRLKMNRFATLWRSSPRTVLLGLATVGLAAAVTVGSGADFTSSTANPSNVFTAGTLAQTNSKPGAAILVATNMRPGDTATGTVDIKNTGSLSGVFSLSKTVTAETLAFASKLTVVVTDNGDPTCVTGCPAAATVYTGTVGAMGTRPLGTFLAGDVHRFSFAVTFPDGGANGADNGYQTASTTVTYTWSAVS